MFNTSKLLPEDQLQENSDYRNKVQDLQSSSDSINTTKVPVV